MKASQFQKTVGRDGERPATFFWSIQKRQADEAIVLLDRRDIASMEEAKADLQATLKALADADTIVMGEA